MEVNHGMNWIFVSLFFPSNFQEKCCVALLVSMCECGGCLWSFHIIWSTTEWVIWQWLLSEPFHRHSTKLCVGVYLNIHSSEYSSKALRFISFSFYCLPSFVSSKVSRSFLSPFSHSFQTTLSRRFSFKCDVLKYSVNYSREEEEKGGRERKRKEEEERERKML